MGTIITHQIASPSELKIVFNATALCAQRRTPAAKNTQSDLSSRAMKNRPITIPYMLQVERKRTHTRHVL